MLSIPISEYIERRQQVLQKLAKENAVLIIPAAAIKYRNLDMDYHYRQHSDFYYLSAMQESDAILVLVPGYNKGESIIFHRHTDPAYEVWHGRLIGEQAAISEYGFDISYDINKFMEFLPDVLQDKKCIYYNLGLSPQMDEQLTQAINTLRSSSRRGTQVPEQYASLDSLVHEMRLIKSEHEIAVMREAGRISAAAHCKLMQLSKPGISEYQLETEFLYDIRNNGCRFPAYTPIIAAGDNATILHYVENNEEINDGELVLIDAGGEYQLYASDITRTFPVNGKFSAEQKIIYEIVLKAQLAVIDLIKPGVKWNELHETSVKVITQELLNLGLLKGKLEYLLHNQEYRRFFMHGTGHFLGLDTHDVGKQKINGEWRALEVGMVFTVEPGIYIRPAEDIDKKWWNIGVRIEDNVVVTSQGCEILSAGAPKSIADIEQLMSSR